MKIELPSQVENIIRTLEQNGHEAYAVGGCVRDSIMGRTPDDWDITTSARPEEVRALFERIVDTGIKHGTVTVMLDHKGYEVTTYRIDGKYGDGRHPDQVTFTPSLMEDLKRRDFTINAMAYHPDRGLVDAFGGQEDLKEGLVRCVGDPDRRFTEDALRMMRAIRFAARFGFTIEPATEGSIRRLSGNLSKVSAERIRDEFLKTIISPHPEEIRKLEFTGLIRVFLPEWEAMAKTPQHTVHHIYDVAEHTVQVMLHVPSDRILRLAALFHDIGKPVTRWTDEEGVDHFTGHPGAGARMTEEIMKRMRFDNATIRKVVPLVRWHDERPSGNPAAIREAVSKIGPDAFPALFTLKRADTLGQSLYKREEKLAAIDRFEAGWKEIRDQGIPVCVRDLAVNGSDLIGEGLAEGPGIGSLLEDLLHAVLKDPSLNTREDLLSLAQKMRREKR